MHGSWDKLTITLLEPKLIGLWPGQPVQTCRLTRPYTIGLLTNNFYLDILKVDHGKVKESWTSSFKKFSRLRVKPFCWNQWTDHQQKLYSRKMVLFYNFYKHLKEILGEVLFQSLPNCGCRICRWSFFKLGYLSHVLPFICC
jgi:hypothetical protein